MSCCHELGQGQVPKYSVVWQVDPGDVEVDELSAVVVASLEGDGEADLLQGAGGTAAALGERLGGTESAMGHVKQAKRLCGEHV